MSLVKYIPFLLLIFIFLGCASQIESAPELIIPTPSQSIPVTPGIFSFKIASDGSGTWPALRDETDGSVQASTVKIESMQTDSVMENLKLLTSGKVDMAFGYDYHATLANEGKLAGVFPNAQPEKLNIKCGVEITRMPFPDYSQPVRIVTPLYEQPILIFTLSNSDIATLQDLRGRRVSIGLSGNVTEELAGYILKALEIQEKDFSRVSLDVNESLSALKAGSVDAFFWSGNPAELAHMSTSGLILLPIRGTEAEAVMQVNPGIFHPSKLSSGSYSGLEVDLDTVAVTPALLTMADFPADKLLQVLAEIFESKRLFAEVFAGGDHSTLGNLSEQLSPPAQRYMHEGTIAYFTNR
jgi:TRAP-type uncharacterized transport system substrate-binding protein